MMVNAPVLSLSYEAADARARVSAPALSKDEGPALDEAILWRTAHTDQSIAAELAIGASVGARVGTWPNRRCAECATSTSRVDKIGGAERENVADQRRLIKMGLRSA